MTALTLVEDGTLRLDDPIDDLVPELANRRVLRAIDAELDDTVPARRAITVDDLLTFRMGFGTVMAQPDAYPIQRGGSGARAPQHRRAAVAARAARRRRMDQGAGLAAAHVPTRRAVDVQHGRAGARRGDRACGWDGPRHSDARAHLRPARHGRHRLLRAGRQADRLTTFYAPDAETGALSVLDVPPDSWWSTPPNFPDASGWLVSTIDDYWTFDVDARRRWRATACASCRRSRSRA